MTALAARLLGDADAARDVCQESFVRLHARLDDVRGDPGPWLRAVAWRLACDVLRRRRREDVALGRVGANQAGDGAVLLPAAADGRASLDDQDDVARVRNALTSLSDRQRDVLLLRIVDGESFPALARTLAISEGSAKVHLRRALERLRGLLGVSATPSRTTEMATRANATMTTTTNVEAP